MYSMCHTERKGSRIWIGVVLQQNVATLQRYITVAVQSYDITLECHLSLHFLPPAPPSQRLPI